MSGRPTYRQGVAQTVHTTYFGVDPRTGRSTGDTAGWVSGRAAKFALNNRGPVNNKLGGGEYLIPIFDDKGNVVAFERSIDQNLKKGLQEDKHLGRVLGAWSGRIVEESEANKFNTQLVQTLKDIYDKAEDKGDFINVADPKQTDPVIRDAWDTMGWKIKEDAANVFGEPDTLWIRKDMVNDAIGFHQASVRDPWTGVSRWSPETQERIKEAAMVFMGDKGYRIMVKGENIVGDVVSYAKTTIVVRSMTVIWENLISNNLHLMSWGVMPWQLVKEQRAKFLEINQYVKNQERILELNAEFSAALEDPSKLARIKAELKVLADANANLSIKPLLDAGEFSTVSESLTEADQAIRDGKLSDYIEMATEKLPQPVQTAFKNFTIAKDTALFQGLNRAVQYGDFVAKAVLYEHLIKNRGYSEKDAMAVIKEEFVNYNRLSGRDRDYLESIGLLWFWNYKVRIMKVMVRMLRERPASALFYAGGIGPMADIDSL